MTAGKVWLVGAGPGDPGLFSLRGKEALEQADVIIYDALADSGLLRFARKDAETIYVGKVADKHALPQKDINELLARKALLGLKVARLKGGDPYIFGRGGEEGEYLAERGIDFEEIPGISSAIAAPAYAGIPLTHRDHASSVMIITGHEKPEKQKSAHNWRAFAESGATLVFVMGMGNLAGICGNLIAAGMDRQTPAAVVYRGSTPMQRKLVSTLEKLPEEARKAGLSNPAVIVVGKVVDLSAKLDWFSRKPLLGKTIVVTRAREQASEIAASLAWLGAQVLECPTIRIEPLEDCPVADMAIDNLDQYRWLIFTSVNGVKYFWQRLARKNLDTRCLGRCKVAAIGPATAGALEAAGVRPDLVPATYVAESVARELIEREGGSLDGMRILLPRAREARSALPDSLEQAGAVVDIAPVYETVPETAEIGMVRELLSSGRLDCVTFGSSSTVRNFFRLLPPEELKASPGTRIAAIGPITAATVAEYGLNADIRPAQFTIPGMIAEIAACYSGAKQ